MRVDHEMMTSENNGGPRLPEHYPAPGAHEQAGSTHEEFRAELRQIGGSRHRKKNTHAAHVPAQRAQLPLIPGRRDWQAITGVVSTVCAFIALGALEWRFRNEAAQAPSVTKDSRTEPPAFMQANPAEKDGSPTDAPAERPVESRTNTPESSAGSASEGVS